MIHFEPLPMLEAHFFLSAKQAGSSVLGYFSGKNAVDLPEDSNMDEYIKILAELEERLNASIMVDESDIAKLYGRIAESENSPDFPTDYFASNLIIGGVERLQFNEGCFEYIRSKADEIPDRIVERILGEGLDEGISQLRAIDIIASSELSNENKLLLIDIILHSETYIDLLERTLLPIAEEFSKCTDLIEPLLLHYRNSCESIASIEDEARVFEVAIKHELPNVKRYDFFPLVTYFNMLTFSFTDTENEKVFVGMGVLYDVLRKHYKDVEDVNTKLSQIMNVLGSKSRFDILAKLSDGPQYGRELAAYLGLTPATVSHHINALLAEGLIKLDTSGKRVYYSLNYDCTENFIGMLQKLLVRPNKLPASR